MQDAQDKELDSSLPEEYHRQFGATPAWLSHTPGRVNLIGEHTDYNGGWVLPFAITEHIVLAGGPAHDRSSVRSLDKEETIEFDARALPPPRPGHWSNYLIGVMAEFAGRGFRLPQLNACFAGNIPQGGGLSSSAALSNCMALLLDRMLASALPREELALISQGSEHHYAGVMCGIMDQYATLFCRQDHALLLDCRTRSYQHVPLTIRPYRFALINSMVKHALADGAYNRRRMECRSALARLRERYPKLEDLRACTPEMLAEEGGKLTGIEYRRVQHQVDENQRVLAAVAALRAGDLVALGRAMHASHISLSENFEVSSPEQDYLVECIMGLKGVLGARMTGGGFGGNVICLVHEACYEALRQSISADYQAKFGMLPEFRLCSPGSGATLTAVIS